MKITALELDGALLIDLEPIKDDRGFFARSLSTFELKTAGISFTLAQADISFSYKRGTLRGMHFQTAPKAQAKIVRCTRGALHDVLVDLRPESRTFKKWAGFRLDAENRAALYIPEGFAHGFLTLEDNTEIHYLVSDEYSPPHYKALRWDDPAVAIQWPFKPVIISEKDAKAPTLDSVLGDLGR